MSGNMNQMLARMRRMKAQIAARKAQESNEPSAEVNTGVGLVTGNSLKTQEQVNEEIAEQLGEHDVDTTSGVPTNLAGNTLRDKSEITLADFNEKQALAVKIAAAGKSFCLIGAAGSGKTTTTRGVITTLKDSGIIGKLSDGTERVLREKAPSVAVLSYTNQAVRNIKEALPPEFKQHCSTFHKLLEYSPVQCEVEVTDENGLWTGEYKKSMYYEPKYGTEPTTGNGQGEYLPSLDVVIVEEAGSVPVDLWQTFLSALPHPEDTIFILLGDLNQLPPVFGDGILGFKLLELPIVELTEVYRNVGLVTKFAHRILEGKPILDAELEQRWNTSDSSGSLVFRAFKTKNDSKVATTTLGSHFKKLVINGKFDTDNDVLLIPFNKQLGTIALNKWLNCGLDIRDNRVVYQVQNGYLTLYFAVGDKILYNKQYCIIKSIEPTEGYSGDIPMQESVYMDRWGRTTADYEFRTAEEESNVEMENIEALMAMALEEIEEGTTLKCSHTFTLEATDESLRDDNGNLPIYSGIHAVGSVNSFLHVLAMSVHKSQGSEWLKVWMILHHTHAVMFKRELLYTGCTRARRDLEVFYSGQKTAHKIGGSPFSQGIVTQELEGDTLEKKLNYFKNKVRAEEVKQALKNGTDIGISTINPRILTVENAEELTARS